MHNFPETYTIIYVWNFMLFQEREYIEICIYKMAGLWERFRSCGLLQGKTDGSGGTGVSGM